ncbi:protein kinase rio1, partial [Tulasnella sp. 408]
MSTIKNSSVIFTSRPDGFPIPGEHLVVRNDTTVNLDSVPLNGGLLVKTFAVSVDPYYRILMDKVYKLGEPLRMIRLAESPGTSSGESFVQSLKVTTRGITYTQRRLEYSVVSREATQLRRIEKDAATWVQYIGVLGLVTRTAWIGFYALAKAKKGETIFVSTAAGGVGSVVVQIAKQHGLRVLGSAGSDDKIKYLKEELGVDAAINYKTEDLDSFLKREGPVDIYWDHVGGKTLETVLDHMNPVGRVIVCGVIDQYNAKDGTGSGPKNFRLIHSRELTVAGFWVNPLEKREGDYGFFKEAPKLVREGKIKIREEVRQGLDTVPQFLLDIQQGKNVGKAVVIVADDQELDNNLDSTLNDSLKSPAEEEHDSAATIGRIDDVHASKHEPNEGLPSLQELMNELQREDEYASGSGSDTAAEGRGDYPLDEEDDQDQEVDSEDDWAQNEIRPEDEDWEVAEKDFTKQYNRLRQHAAVYNRTARPEVTSKQKGTAVLSLPPVNKPRKVPTSTTTPTATPAAPAESSSSKLSITTDQLALLQKYNSRLANLTEPYNALGMGAGVNRKGPSAVANRKDKADRATTEQVLDPRTRLILYKMIGRGVIFEVNGCISTGKEANVYHALSPEHAHIALKIYKTSILVFKDRDRYVTGEHRFRRGYAKHNPRKMVRLWAEKEMRNLKRLTDANVRCPEPIEVRENVLVMQFLGDAEGWASPRLKDANVPSEVLPSLYAELLITVRVLYHVCRLVHADLSEYNILFHRSHLYMIDVSQSVEHDHPHALEFLRTDLTNVDEWFKKRGVRTLGLRRSFDFVVSSDENLGLGKLVEEEDVPTLVPLVEPSPQAPPAGDGASNEAHSTESTAEIEHPKYAKTVEYKALEKTLENWLSEDSRPTPVSNQSGGNPPPRTDSAVDHAQEDAVFRSSYIPRTLNEVVDPERDAEILRRGEGKSLIYDGVIGVAARPVKEVNQAEISKVGVERLAADESREDGDDDNGKGDSESDEDEDEDEEDGEEGAETRPKKPKGRRGEDKEAKKERQKLQKEAAREKRKTKMPKAEKQAKIRKTKR